MAFIVICVTIFLSGFLYTYLIPLVPSYHLITGAYFSTAEVALLFASYSFGKTCSRFENSFIVLIHILHKCAMRCGPLLYVSADYLWVSVCGYIYILHT